MFVDDSDYWLKCRLGEPHLEILKSILVTSASLQGPKCLDISCQRPMVKEKQPGFCLSTRDFNAAGLSAQSDKQSGF